MRLNITPDGGRFHVERNRLVISVSIVSDTPVELAGDPVINDALISQDGGENLSFGFSQCVTRLPGEAITIDEHSPYNAIVNMLEYDDDVSELTPGSYRMKVTVSALVRRESGDLKFVELSEVMPITLE